MPNEAVLGSPHFWLPLSIKKQNYKLCIWCDCLDLNLFWLYKYFYKQAQGVYKVTKFFTDQNVLILYSKTHISFSKHLICFMIMPKHS